LHGAISRLSHRTHQIFALSPKKRWFIELIDVLELGDALRELQMSEKIND